MLTNALQYLWLCCKIVTLPNFHIELKIQCSKCDESIALKPVDIHKQLEVLYRKGWRVAKRKNLRCYCNYCAGK